MDHMQIVTFFYSTEPSAPLNHLISIIAHSISFQLPEQTGQELSSDVVIQQALQLSPELVLIEVSTKYDVEAFITSFRRLYEGDMPAIVGVFDGALSEKALAQVSELSIDSYLFTHWSEAKLRDRLDNMLRLRAYNLKLRDQIKASSQTALTAKKAFTEVGMLMQMIDWLQSAQTVKEVSDCVLKLCRSLDLTAMMLVVDGENEHLFPEGMVNSSVRSLIDGVYGQSSRIVSKSRFLAFRMNVIVLLVTNAPWQDAGRYGRYRDILFQCVAIADSRARTISVNSLIAAQHNQVASIMKLIKRSSTETHLYAKSIIQELSEKLSLAAVSLDLSDEQERILQNLSGEAYDSIEHLYKSNDALESHFHALVSSIMTVRELTRPQVAKEQNPFAEDDDITLF